MAEMRNALIETGVEGWAQKQPMDTVAPAERIGRTSPDVALQLRTWLGAAKAATIYHPQEQAASRARWSMMAPAFRAPVDPGSLAGTMQRERMTTGDRLDRYREAQRFRGGLLSPESAPPAGAQPRGLLGAQRERRGLLSQ